MPADHPPCDCDRCETAALDLAAFRAVMNAEDPATRKTIELVAAWVGVDPDQLEALVRAEERK